MPEASEDDIHIVEPSEPWRHDGAGYPPEAGLDDPDPDCLPESAGMAEDGTEDDGKHHAPAENRPVPVMHELGSHLDELRRRLIISLSVFVPLFGVGFWQYQNLWRIIIHPLHRAAPHLSNFQALSPSDGLVMAMRIAFAFAFFISLPVWLSQIWNFVAPGLTARERRWVYLSLGSGGVLFAVGVCLAYFVGIPLALEFLLLFNQSMDGWENAFTGFGYVDFIITCCAGFGLSFELPLVMLVLGWLGLLTPEILKKSWRMVALAIFILAALLTPPDPFTQLLLALPMVALFVVGYLLVKWVHRENGERDGEKRG